MARWLDRLRTAVGLDRGRNRPRDRASDTDLDDITREFEHHVADQRGSKALRTLEKALRRFPTDPDVAALVGDLAYDRGAFPEAAHAFDLATRLAPDDATSPALLAACLLEDGDVEAAREAVAESLRRDPESPDGTWWRGVLHDLDGEDEKSMRCYRRAATAAPEEYFVPARQTRKRFQRMAEKAWLSLERDYEGFGEALASRNVTVRIQDVPSPEQIADGYNPLWLGVFQGHMGPEISLEDPWSGLPAHVILFQRNLERDCRSRSELQEQVRITLLHEAAHAHGREEDWMEDRGLE